MITLLLLGCTASPASPAGSDSGGETGATVDDGIGDVIEMETTEAGVSGSFSEPGTYVVVLFSAATEQDTYYGYGDRAEAAPLSTPPDPLPDPEIEAPVPVVFATVGDYRNFTVWDGSGYVIVEALAVEVTDELVIWNDVTTFNPLGDLPAATLDEVVATFEDVVLPRTRQVFGQESDVDGSGKIDVLLSFTVNDYGAVAYVTWCDLADLRGCGGRSNGGETIYMGIPDPDSEYSTANAIAEIWAHELNHLVYAWHKYMGNDQLDADENIYLTEGMSELAQDLTGFNNGNQYIWASAIDMREFYGNEDYSTQGVSINDFLREGSYYSARRDGPLRGGGYLFLRYLFEQAGGFVVESDGSFTDAGGIEFLHEWFDAPELGPDCVEALTGRPVEDVAFDWYTALVLSGRDINDNPAFTYQERVQDPITGFEFGVDTYAVIHGWLTLNGPPVQPLDEADGKLRAGGVEYLEVVVDESGTVEIAVDAAALPRARAFRIE